MAKYKKTAGNYVEALQAVGLPASFSSVSEDASATILKDIPRAPFVAFDSKTFDTLRETWVDGEVSRSYSQGNITAGLFSELLMVLNGHETRANVCFAYYDDKDVPCGFSISYSDDDPSVWVASMISNTTADPEDRTVTVFSHEDIIPDGVSQDIQAADVLKPLNSRSVSLLLAEIIQEDGAVNTQVLSVLKKRIATNQNIDNRDVRIAQFDELVELARPSFSEDQLAEIARSRADQNFYQYDNFIEAIDGVTTLFKSHVEQSDSKDRSIYDLDLLSMAIKFELKATTYTEEGDKYKKMGLELQANRLRAVIANPDLEIKELDYAQLEVEAEGPLAEEAVYLEQLAKFDAHLSALEAPHSSSYLSHVTTKIQREKQSNPDFLNKENIEKALEMIKKLTHCQVNVARFERDLKKAERHDVLFQKGSDVLAGLKQDVSNSKKMSELDSISERVLEANEAFNEQKKQADFEYRFYALRDSVNEPENEYLQTLFAQTQALVSDHLDEQDFLNTAAYRRANKSLDELDVYSESLQEFQNCLSVLGDDESSPLLNQVKRLLQDIKDVVKHDPNALLKMSEILQCSKVALLTPQDNENIKKLEALSQEATQKESKAWQKLGAGLWMFVGAIMMLAGVVLAVPTLGLSLAMTLMGALEVGQGQALWQEAKEEQGLQRSASFFKAALADITNDERVPSRKSSESDSDDSGLGESPLATPRTSPSRH